MAKPNVSINFDNGAIGSAGASSDGVVAFVATATQEGDVSNPTFELNKPYLVRSMRDVAELELDSAANSRLLKALTEFYNEAGGTAELWVMGMPDTQKVSDWFAVDVATGVAPVEKLLDQANGSINAIFTVYNGETTLDTDANIDSDVLEAANKAQILAEKYTKEKYAPFVTFVEAYAFGGDVTKLPTLSESDFNRVGIVLGDTEARTEADGSVNSLGAAMGLVAGRFAITSVHENVGRVKDGALTSLSMYIVDEKVELADTDTIYNKGYISFRTFQGKSGYYIIDEPLATGDADDYKYISRRRTIDKAYRIIYQTLVDEINDEVNVTNEGKIDFLYAKTIEGVIERNIFTQMTANGELSVDAANKDDVGVEATINTESEFIKTSTVEVDVRVRPKGHARFFDVLLGYQIQN